MARLSLGLYIGDASAVVAEVDSSGEWVERFGQINLPAGTMERGEVRNKEALLNALQELKKKTEPRINGREEVVLGIAEQRVFLREFAVARGTTKIDDRITASIRAILPTLPEEMVWDFMILGEDESGEIKALMVAVPKRVVDDMVEVIQAAGLAVARVETKMMAIAREIKREQVRGKDQLLVYQSETALIMSYMTNGKIRFSSVIRVEEVVRQGGTARVVANAIGYVNSRYPGRQIQELMMADGVGSVTELAAALQTLGLPIVRAQSRLVGTKVPGIVVMQPSIGLSMSDLDDEKDRIDLTPPVYRVKAKVREIRGLARSSLLVMLIASVMLVVGLFVWWQSLQAEERTLRLAQTQFETSGAKQLRVELNEEIRDFNSLLDELAAAVKMTGGGAEVLQQLSGAVVPGIELQGLLYARGREAGALNVRPESYLVNGEADRRERVLVFQDSLLQQPAFEGGRLYFGSLEKETEVLFRIVGGDGQRR